jgi:hypothetical protein
MIEHDPFGAEEGEPWGEPFVVGIPTYVRNIKTSAYPKGITMIPLRDVNQLLRGQHIKFEIREGEKD